jgi:hypothetical protein
MAYYCYTDEWWKFVSQTFGKSIIIPDFDIRKEKVNNYEITHSKGINCTCQSISRFHFMKMNSMKMNSMNQLNMENAS